MKCKFCGSENEVGASFCVNCGAKIKTEQEVQNDNAAQPAQPVQTQPTQPYGQQNNPYGQQYNQPYGQQNTPYGQQYNQPYGQQNNPYGQQYNQPYGQPNNPYGQYAQASDRPMKWFKFLIYFALFAGAILNLLNGIIVLDGGHYDQQGGSGSAELVYTVFPDMEGWDQFYGIMLIALGIFMVVTRFMLSSYKKIGPIFLLAVYAANVVLPIIYVVGASSVLGESAFDPSMAISLIVSAAMIIANFIYFRNRKHLFVR